MASCRVSSGEDVGTYAITQGDLSLGGNYDLSFVSANLTITEKALSLVAEDDSKVFGSANPVFGYHFVGFQNDDDESDLTGTVSCVSPADETSPVGTYSIHCDGVSSANYTISSVDATLTVTPAALSLVAEDDSKVFGSANPAFGYHFVGFQNDDDESDLTGTVQLCLAGG